LLKKSSVKLETNQVTKSRKSDTHIACRGVRSHNFVGPNPILIRNHNSCILIHYFFYFFFSVIAASLIFKSFYIVLIGWLKAGPSK